MNLDHNSNNNSISVHSIQYRNNILQPQQNQHQSQNNMSNFISIDENDSIYPNNSHELNNNNLTLKQQAMLNQFISIAGCSYEQAKSLLSSSNWQYQTALSVFFDDFSIVTPAPYHQFHHLNRPLIPLNNNSFNNSNVNNLSICAPSNTPVTPPNLEYLEKAFSKLNPSFNTIASSSSSSSPFSNFNS